ncbi:MAG: hypothetical protein ACLFSB_03840 [Chitinispirillaceae bacterium]
MQSTAPSDDRNQYRCIVSDSAGSDTSDYARLHIIYTDSFTGLEKCFLLLRLLHQWKSMTSRDHYLSANTHAVGSGPEATQALTQFRQIENKLS